MKIYTNKVELLGRTKSKITKKKKKKKNGENGPHLEITKVVLIHGNVVNNSHHQRVFHRFVPNKSFGQLLDISPKKFIF